MDYMYAKFNRPTFRTLEGVGEQKKCNEEKEIIIINNNNKEFEEKE